MIVVSQIINLRYIKTFLAPERHYHQTSHVNRSHECSHCSDKPESFRGPARHVEWSSRPNLPENFIFRKEPRPDRYAADRQPSGAHRDPGDRHVLAQISHPPHVL